MSTSAENNFRYTGRTSKYSLCCFQSLNNTHDTLDNLCGLSKDVYIPWMYILFLTFYSIQCSGGVQYETGVTTIQTILSKYLSLFFFSLSPDEKLKVQSLFLSVVVCFHVCLSFFPSFLSSYSCLFQHTIFVASLAKIMNAQLEWRGLNVQYHADTQVMEKDAKVGVTVQKTTVVL